MRRWRILVVLPLLVAQTACITGLGPMPRARTGEYSFGGSSLWDSYQDMSLRARYGHFFTPNIQFGGSVNYSRFKFNSNDDATNRYGIGAEANYLIPLAAQATALYFGALARYSKITDQDGVFSYGVQAGSKFFVREDWNVDAGAMAKWSDDEFDDDDEPRISLFVHFNPIIGGGLRDQARTGTGLLFAPGVWLVDGRASWQVKPDNVLRLNPTVGYFLTAAWLIAADLDYQRTKPDNFDAFSTTALNATVAYLFPVTSRIWRPYVAANAAVFDATDQESVFGYGAAAGIRWFKTTNVTPFAQFGVQNYDDSNISAEWTLRVGIQQVLRPRLPL